jgi:RimJ/RimL family protein N-acetyltransferase
MSERWAAERQVFARCFAGLEEAGYQLERTELESYWELHENVMREHFPAEVFVDTSQLRSPQAKRKQAERVARRADDPLCDFTIVRKGGEVVAQFCGEQRGPETYRMWHSNVHSGHRRQGLYGMIVGSTLEYTRQLGFDRVVSEHAPGNNPVLIAKLKAGFRITGLDVEPSVGVSVHLTYFHDPDQLAAYQWRCGLATVTPKLVASGRGAMPLLREQLGK